MMGTFCIFLSKYSCSYVASGRIYHKNRFNYFMNAYYFMLITGGLSQKLHPFHQNNEYY